MRILSLNLFGYSSWEQRQKVIVDYIQSVNPDVVIMQEDVYLPHISPYSPSQRLNQTLQFPFHHSAITRLQESPSTPYFREGLAVFSRLPIVSSETLVLKQDPRDEHQRIIQCVDIQSTEGVVKLANIHLSIEDNLPFPVAQLKEMLQIFSDREERRIIGGDFNIHDLETHRSLWESDYIATTDTPYISYPSEDKRIDYFLVPKTYQRERLEVSTTEYLSDHRALTIDISPLVATSNLL